MVFLLVREKEVITTSNFSLDPGKQNIASCRNSPKSHLIRQYAADSVLEQAN